MLGKPLIAHCKPMLTVNEAVPAMESFNTGDEVVIDVNVSSHLVEPLTVDVVSLSLKVKDLNLRQASQFSLFNMSRRYSRRQSSITSTCSLSLYSQLVLHESVRTSWRPLDLVEFNDWKADGETLSTCGVVCHSLTLPQVDHGLSSIRERPVKLRSDSDLILSQTHFQLMPGENIIRFTKKVRIAVLFWRFVSLL